MILCYPVITFGEYGHKGSRVNLLGPDAAEELAGKLSLETRVGVGTVPAFLWHTYEDDSVPVENSLQYALALRKAKVPFEMHIYEKGCHGLSLCDETTSQYEYQLVPDDTDWIQSAIRWVKRGNR
jgi:acetyl esterase/lipase